MSDLPTRQQVLDALLADRVNRVASSTGEHFSNCFDYVVAAELDAVDGKGHYDELLERVSERYHFGQSVLRDWRLMQSETFDPSVSLEMVMNHQQILLRRGVLMPLVRIYVGYIPTDACMRYVGLAPRGKDGEA